MATSTPSTTQPTLPPHATFHNYGRILRSTQGPPIQAKTHALLESLSELFPTRHHDIDPCFHDDNWYLYALGGLIGTGHAENVGDLYTYLIETGKYGTEGSVERKKMVRRLREGLVKLVILCGIPNVMVGVASLAKVLKEGDRVESTTRVGWQVGEGNEAKGRETIERLYGADSRGVSESFKSFQDFGWLSNNVTYGLFLADHRILDIKETLLLTLPAVLGSGMQGPSERNVKAALRLGFSLEEVEAVQRVVDVLFGWKEGAEKAEWVGAGSVKVKDALSSLREEGGIKL